MKTKGWRTKEARSAKRHRGKRMGGPGKPDYMRGDVLGEVKHRKTPVTKPEVKEIIKKAQKQGVEKVEIISTGGFTGRAEEYIDRYYKDRVRLLKK